MALEVCDGRMEQRNHHLAHGVGHAVGRVQGEHLPCHSGVQVAGQTTARQQADRIAEQLVCLVLALGRWMVSSPTQAAVGHYWKQAQVQMERRQGLYHWAQRMEQEQME